MSKDKEIILNENTINGFKEEDIELAVSIIKKFDKHTFSEVVNVLYLTRKIASDNSIL